MMDEIETLRDCRGIGRNVLEARIGTLCKRVLTLEKELAHYRASGLCLPGWNCPQCSGFNGSEKEVLTQCRACGCDKPGTRLAAGGP